MFGEKVLPAPDLYRATLSDTLQLCDFSALALSTRTIEFKTHLTLPKRRISPSLTYVPHAVPVLLHLTSFI